MKVIRLQDLIETEREVLCPRGGFTSYRFALAQEGMGFSVHKTIVPKGQRQHWHYKNHKEACYCISGVGVLTNKKNGEEHMISPDTCYLLDANDDHFFEALSDVILISIFNPPCKGTELHDENGAYEA